PPAAGRPAATSPTTTANPNSAAMVPYGSATVTSGTSVLPRAATTAGPSAGPTARPGSAPHSVSATDPTGTIWTPSRRYMPIALSRPSSRTRSTSDSVSVFTTP